MLTGISSAWRKTLAQLIVLFGWIFAWYWETAVSMFDIWMRSGTYAHAFVVPPISLWLVWRQRESLRLVEPRPAISMIFPLAVTVFFCLLGELTFVNALRQFAFVGMLILAAVTILGRTASKQILFPLAFLLFAVPFGDFIVPRLMDWTAVFTVGALRATGIPVYQEGLQFVIPSGNWSVVEACSGIRYIIASVTVGTLFAYLNYVSLKRRLIFVAISALVPLVANWLRAYMIVMLGHLSNNKLAAGVDHLIYGWVFFGFVIILMFMIGARWSEPEIAKVTPPEIATENCAGSQGWLVAMIIAITTLTGPLAFRVLDANTHNLSPVITGLRAPAGWEESSQGIDFEPAYNSPSSELKATYTKDGKAVAIRIYFYRNQDDRRKMVTSTNALVTRSDSDWKLLHQSVHPVAIGGLPKNVVSSQLLEGRTSPAINLLVWRWYWIGGKLTSSDMLAKIYTAMSRLRGEGDDSAVVIIYTANESASVALSEFAEAAGSSIEQLLMSTSRY